MLMDLIPCEIVEEVAGSQLAIIDVGTAEGFGTVPSSWLTPIPGKEKVQVAEQPQVGWVARDKDGDIWHHFQFGNFMRPGSKDPESWAEIQKYAPFTEMK
jgi:hypothetical protein